MHRKTSLASLALIATSGLAIADQIITSVGDCNVNIIGDGNNVTIRCVSGETTESSEHLLLITRDREPPANIRNINPDFVDPDRSRYRLRIDGETIIDTRWSETFDDVDLRLQTGDYPYRMSVKVRYIDGHSSTTHCSGIIRLRASATIIPRFRIAVDETGRLSPRGCRFVAKDE